MMKCEVDADCEVIVNLNDGSTETVRGCISLNVDSTGLRLNNDDDTIVAFFQDRAYAWFRVQKKADEEDEVAS